MPSSTNVTAAVETSAIQLAYALQSDGNTFPASGWKALRVTSESLGIQQQTSRSNEMTGRRQVSPSTLRQVAAQGDIGFNLSYGTFDDLFAAALGNDWTAPLNIASAAGDISFVAAGNKLTSTTVSKFANIVAGQWIRIFGATASAGSNNGIYRVAVKTSNQDITLAGRPVVNETPAGATLLIRGSMLRNADQTQLIAFQKQVSTAEFYRYPAAMIGGFTLQGGLDNDFTGTFNVMARTETASATTAGSVAAAPGGGFFDCVASFGGIQVDDVAVDALVTSLNIQVTREGAAMQRGMGSAAALGNRFGQVGVGGSIAIAWRNATLYTRAMASTLGTITAVMRDAQDNAYALSLPASMLRNGSPQASGPNGDVTATYTIEGGQDLAQHCIQLDRLAAAP